MPRSAGKGGVEDQKGWERVSLDSRSNRGARSFHGSSAFPACALRRSHTHVFLDPVLDVGLLLRLQCAGDFAGHSEDERAARDNGRLGDESLGADDGVMTDDGAVEDGGAHADETFVLDRAGVDHGGVTDRDVAPDADRVLVGQVDDGAVLHVGGFADLDEVDVTAGLMNLFPVATLAL